MKNKLKELRKKKKQGFTLIELLVVIAIIIVLMAMLIPALTKYLKDANDAADSANARAAYSAAAAYATSTITKGGDPSTDGLAGTKLDEYFGNRPSTSELAAKINADGTVVWAGYKKSSSATPAYYPSGKHTGDWPTS